MSKIYEQLKALIDPLVQHFRDDLLVHDKRDIEARDGVPFLHWTHFSGTTIVFLPPADSEEYPKFGVQVSYLFGMADRHHILEEKVDLAKYHLKASTNLNYYTCHYFDGKRLKRVDVVQAIKIAEEYARPIRQAWHLERIKHEDPRRYREMRDAGQLCA